MPKLVGGLKQEVAEIFKQLRVLEKFQHRFSYDLFVQAWSTVEWPQKVKEGVEEAQYDLEKDKAHMTTVLERQRQAYQESLTDYARQVEEFTKCVTIAVAVAVVLVGGCVSVALRAFINHPYIYSFILASIHLSIHPFAHSFTSSPVLLW